MRDLSGKSTTLRTAIARATLAAAAETIRRVREGTAPKGDPLSVARVAAIQAAKETSRLIPYCHPVAIDFVGVEFELGEEAIDVVATVKAVDRTGVEMEALTAASVAALTLYDMLKMIDESMEIRRIALLEKTGGVSDFRRKATVAGLRAAVLVMSDSVAAGRAEDESGRRIAERLVREGIDVAEQKVLPDDREAIAGALRRCADELALDLVITTGGSGFGPRDVTPEAMGDAIDRDVPGIPEALRAYGQERTPYAMLSRARAGLRGKTLIVNLPGSPRAVLESLDALFPAVLHAFRMIAGADHRGRGEKP